MYFKAYLLLYLFFFTLIPTASQELIPKAELFNTINISKVGYLSKGDLVIYTSSEKPNKLLLLNTKNKKVKEVDIKNKIVSYTVSNENILLLTSNGKINFLEKLNIKNDSVLSIKSPLNLIPFKLITQSKLHTNKIVFQGYDTENKTTDFYKIDINNPDLISIKIDNSQNFKEVFFDHDLNIVGGSKLNELGGVSLFVKDKKETWQEISKNRWDVTQFLGGFQKILSVSTDGNEVFYLDNSDSDKTILKVYNRASGDISIKSKSQIGDLLPFGFSKNEKDQVVSVVTLFDKTYRYSSDESIKNDFKFVEAKLKTSIGFVDNNEANSKWIIRTVDGKPSDYYHFNRKSKKLTLLLNEFPELKKYQFANRKGYKIKTSDDLSLPFHVYLPPGADKNKDGIPDKPLPTVMFAHGGPWVGVIQWNGYNFWRHYQLLANRGYAVVVMEFRGSSGYGKEFIDKSNYQWGKNMLNDKIEITNWAIQNKIADKNKIAIWGWSYGGYATLSALTFSPNVYACGIAMYPPTDLQAFMKLPQYGETNLWNNRVANSKTQKGQELLRNISPINHIEKIKKPLLLSSGTLDKMVPIGQVNSFAKALEEKDKNFSYLLYDNEGHDYVNLNTWFTFWNAGEEFLKSYLGGKSELSKVPESYQNLDIKYNTLNLKIR